MAFKHIIEFQVAHGLTPAPNVGPKTIAAMRKLWGISKEQLANFLGQIAHETLNFDLDTENLNYSVKRLLEIFKSDFDTNRDKWLTDAEKQKVYSLVGNPQKIANFVYANQNGNGPESSGDGWWFRGRGPLQTTGRANYVALQNWLRAKGIMVDLVKNPELVASTYYWESALFFFERNKLWVPALVVNTANIKKIGKCINGGLNGLDDRIAKTNYYYEKIKLAA